MRCHFSLNLTCCYGFSCQLNLPIYYVSYSCFFFLLVLASIFIKILVEFNHNQSHLLAPAEVTLNVTLTAHSLLCPAAPVNRFRCLLLHSKTCKHEQDRTQGCLNIVSTFFFGVLDCQFAVLFDHAIYNEIVTWWEKVATFLLNTVC